MAGSLPRLVSGARGVARREAKPTLLADSQGRVWVHGVARVSAVRNVERGPVVGREREEGTDLAERSRSGRRPGPQQPSCFSHAPTIAAPGVSNREIPQREIPATTYFPRELPPKYLRRWRA